MTEQQLVWRESTTAEYPIASISFVMVITLGLLFTDKKFRRLNEVGVFADFNAFGIRTFRIDLFKPLSEQDHVDAIFHKIISIFLSHGGRYADYWLDEGNTFNASSSVVDR